MVHTSGVPRNFVPGGGSTNSAEDRGQRERGPGGSGPLVRGSGDSCNLVFRGGLNPPNHPLGTPLVHTEPLYGIFVIFNGSRLCVNISSSELYLMSRKYFLCGCVLHKKGTPTYVAVNTNFKFSVVKALRSFSTWSLQSGGDGQQSLLWRYAVSTVDVLHGLVRP
jgi:hypothetical protein